MKRRPVRLSCAVALHAILLTHTAGAEPRRLDLEDVASLVKVSDPQLSPDGRWIVCVVGRPNVQDARYDRSLVLIDVASASQRVLTYDRKGASTPRWSPSGDRIAFLDASVQSSHDEGAGTPRNQVFVMPMNGGDAYRITNAPSDVEQFAWSPDGTHIAYVTADENPNKKEIARHNDAFEVGDNDYLATEAQMPSHVWLVSADGSSAHRLTSGTWSLPKGAPFSAPASPLSWSADGKSIAIVQQATANLGDSDQSVVSTLDVASGKLRKLTGHKAFEANPQYSPDGSAVAYWYPRDGDPNNENELFVTNSAGGDGVDLTRVLDRDIAQAIWMRDGESLLVAAHDGTGLGMWIQPRNGAARRLNLGDIVAAWSGVWVDITLGSDGSLAFVGSSPTHPNEIYYLPAGGSTPRRLTVFNQEIASRNLGHTEEFRWKGPNGFQEDGVVVYPPGFEPQRKYPLVLAIHGGPVYSSTVSFDALAQLLAAHDYVVFSPNYRGSDNRGNTYQRAIVNDSGDGPGRDVMAGIRALEQHGFVDQARIAVSGWSYGGYMTSWLIGHYHIWKAAVSGAAVNDLVHMYALGDFNVGYRYGMGGSPWSGNLMKNFQEQSPITFARQVTTPTLILADTFDVRVPTTQSYLMYHALKDNGVPVQFFAYPVPGHFPGDPVRGPDVYRRWIQWIDRYLGTPQ